MISLLSSNLLSFDTKALKVIANNALKQDLSLRHESTVDPIKLLTMMKHPGTSEQEALETSQLIQRHITFTFLISMSSTFAFDLMEMLDGLSFTAWETESTLDLFLVTASLDLWCELICKYSVEHMNPMILRVLNSVQSKLEDIGLSAVFKNYAKQSRKDGTYYLCYS